MDVQECTLATKIQLAFKSMEYGSSTESEIIVKEWITQHNGTFGIFKNNEHIQIPSCPTISLSNPSTGVKLVPVFDPEHIADIKRRDEIDISLNELSWGALIPHQRAKLLYSLAASIQKNQHLLSLVESVSTGRHISSTTSVDTPNLIRSLYHSIGIAQRSKQTVSGKVINIVSTEAPTPIFSLCWKFLPYFAHGHRIVISVSPDCCLSAFLFADLCQKSGFPDGSVTVFLIDPKDPLGLTEKQTFLKIFYQGSMLTGQNLVRKSALSLIPVEIVPSKRLTAIVLESSDRKSAIDSILLASHSGIGTQHGCRLLIQESIYVNFVKELKEKFALLRVGIWNDKTLDLTCCITDTQQVDDLLAAVKDAKSDGATVLTTETSYPVYLVLGVQPVSQIVQEQVKGIVIVVLAFRTVKESIALANSSPGCECLSIWSERLTVALEVAQGVNATTIWVNGHNNYDASGELKNSNLENFAHDFDGEIAEGFEKTFGTSAGCDKSKKILSPSSQLDSYKLYYGGSPKQPDGDSFYEIKGASKQLGFAPEANQKDAWNAVGAAMTAKTSWKLRNGHSKARLFFALAEELSNANQSFCELMASVEDLSPVEVKDKLSNAVDCLYAGAAFADKNSGQVLNSPLSNFCVSLDEPHGVLAIICAKSDFVSLIKILTAATLTGNTVILVPPQINPLLALSLHQFLSNSEWPAGVVNVLSGNTEHLTKNLCLHNGVNAIWIDNHSEANQKAFCLYYSHQKSLHTFSNGGSLESLVPLGKRAKRLYMNSGETFAN